MTISQPHNLRRVEAAKHLRDKFGLPISKSWLDRAACKGNGPRVRYFNSTPLYPIADLDEWAEAALSKPVTSTAGRRARVAA